MKSTLILGSIVLLASLGIQTGTGKALLDGQAKVLKSAQSLSVKFTTQKLPGAAEDCRLVFSRPNKLRLENSSGVFVTDGKTTWKYDKSSNSYVENPAAANDAISLSTSESAFAWASFFGEPYKDSKTATLGTKRNLKGVVVQEVVVVLADNKTITLMIDPKTNLPRGAIVKFGEQENLVIASEVNIAATDALNEEFVFSPPAGATKLDKPKELEITWASVVPIFRSRCMPCHSSGRVSGGYNLTSYDAVMAANIVKPGDPANSKLLGTVKHTFGSPMPKNGSKLPESEIQIIEKWIAGGAKP